MAAFDPVKVLENVINRLRQHDPSGFFDDPVTDQEAPNYSQVISQPMCFSAMREKVRNREYKTWGAFVRDFELICSNAVIYNQQKSKVHKAAKAMLRQGKTDLQDSELEGRKAVYLLHPGGPAEAAMEEAEEFTQQNQAPPINAFLLCPGHTPLPPPLGDQEDIDNAQYSCYSDTDSEDTRGQGPLTPGEMDKFLKSLDRPVVWQPWQAGVGVSSSGPAKDEVCPEWWARRRHVEWQCRWLELRLLELQSHRYRYARSSKPPRSLSVLTTSTAAPPATDNSARPKKIKRKTERCQFPDLSSDRLLRHPFFGLRFGALKPEDVFMKGSEGCGNGDYELGKMSGSVGLDMEELCFGAQVHVGLGVLTEEMKKIMGLLQARKKMSQSHQKQPPPRPHKKSSSVTNRKPTARLDSKRSRREFEMEDMVTPMGLAPATAVVERPPKTNIMVPKVDILSKEELGLRKKAVDAWRPLLTADGSSAAVPEEVKCVAANGSDGTSEEELTDEAFLLRHKDMESTEQERHVSVFGPPKKQKGGGGGGQRVPQRLGQATREAVAREGGFQGSNPHSNTTSFPGDAHCRGRGRGRRPGTGIRGRPPMGGRRGGMSIGIPMMSQPMQASQIPQYFPGHSAPPISVVPQVPHYGVPAPLHQHMPPYTPSGVSPPTAVVPPPLPHAVMPFSAPVITTSSLNVVTMESPVPPASAAEPDQPCGSTKAKIRPEFSSAGQAVPGVSVSPPEEINLLSESRADEDDLQDPTGLDAMDIVLDASSSLPDGDDPVGPQPASSLAKDPPSSGTKEVPKVLQTSEADMETDLDEDEGERDEHKAPPRSAVPNNVNLEQNPAQLNPKENIDSIPPLVAAHPDSSGSASMELTKSVVPPLVPPVSRSEVIDVADCPMDGADVHDLTSTSPPLGPPPPATSLSILHAHPMNPAPVAHAPAAHIPTLISIPVRDPIDMGSRVYFQSAPAQVSTDSPANEGAPLILRPSALSTLPPMSLSPEMVGLPLSTQIPQSCQPLPGLPTVIQPQTPISQAPPGALILAPVIRQPNPLLTPLFSAPMAQTTTGGATMSGIPWTMIQEIRLLSNPGTVPRNSFQTFPAGSTTTGVSSLSRLPSGVLDVVEKPKDTDVSAVQPKNG